MTWSVCWMDTSMYEHPNMCTDLKQPETGPAFPTRLRDPSTFPPA